MEFIIYSKADLTKNGFFKKHNNINVYTENGFKKYIKNNNLNLSKSNIGLIGILSNNLKFKCYHNNKKIEVTKIINNINNIGDI